GFSAENITIENSFVEKGEANEQAVAFHNQADQSMLINVRFIGNQDTLLANTSSQESAARQYYYNCYIEGDVDFLFGRAQAIFDSCEIASYNRQSPNGVSNGYVTAASTWDRDEYGYLVINSKLIGLDKVPAIIRDYDDKKSAS
ncbi:pectin esterase, partial [Acinetobacter baumannii]